MNLLDEAALFLDEARNTLLHALPFASPEDIETEAWLNEDNNIVVGEFEAPLIHGAGQTKDTAQFLAHDNTMPISVT